MSERRPVDATALLDALVREARAQGDEAGGADDALVARAALAGRARHEARRRRRALAAVSGALALAACVALAWLGAPDEPRPPPSDIVELTLPTGDRLAATGDARFDVARSEPARRVVRLRRGAMLFDVAPLAGGASFEVETPDARVRVRGTVFAVDAGDEGTAVRVYEGRVELRRAQGAVIVLEGGESDGALGARVAALDARGLAAAASRAERRPAAEPAPLEVAEPVLEARTPAPVVATGPRPASRRASRTESEGETRAPPVLLEEARGHVAAARWQDALALASERAPADPEWRLLEADALRGLGRSEEAAAAYEDAARRLHGVAARAAAFLAAELRLRRLRDPAAALRALDEAGADAPGSPLRERGLALRADALEQLDRRAELRQVAETYLAEMPSGPRAAAMRAHLDAR